MPADPEIAHLLENLNANAQLSIEEDGAEIEPNVQVLNFTEALEATDQGGQQVNVEVPDGGIDASKIGSGAVGTDELADNSVTSAKIPADAIGSSEIATDAVGSDEIAAGAVGESELDLSITPTWTGQHQFNAGIDVRGDIVDAGAVIYDTSGGHIEQSILENDSVTVAGNTVALGGSTSVDHSDLSNIGSADHHTRYSNEEAQDAVGTIMSGGTGITVTYDDAGNTITVTGHNKYTDEEAQDAVGTILGSNFTYDDVTPSITLASDSVTVTAGDGLKNGGTVALGGTITIDIEPADFAGNALEDDGADNLAVSSGAIQTDELDLSITPTWTGEHQFNAGIEIAEGQSIEDDGDVDRISIESNTTRMLNERGETAFAAFGGNIHRIRALSDTPVEIFDVEGGFTAVQYDTDASGGVLRTPNSSIVVQDDGEPSISSGEGLSVTYVSGTGFLRPLNFDTSTVQTLKIDGNPLELGGRGGLVDMSVEAADLRLATGQAIEDGGGNRRVELRTNDTLISGGDNGSDGTAHILFRDDVGGFTPFQYIASSSAPGEVRFSNAFLDMFGNRIQDPSLIDFADLAGDNNKWGLSPDGSGNLNLDYGGAFRFSFRQGGNLRLATGQSIEDGGGTDRFLINSNQTKLLNNSGSDAFDANSGDHHRIVAFSNTPITFFDAGGGFTAVQYLTSASAPGTLELTNAEIDTADNNIEGGSSTLFFDGGSTGSGALRWGDQGGGSDPRLWVSADGEVNASDDDGNTTQLT